MVAVVWLACIALTNPRGNFPRHDDWDFAIATWRFAGTGHFSFTPFTAVSLRAQVLWGALWTRLFGESFDVLRMSTIVLAALTIAIVNRTLAHAGAGRFARVLGALALGFHPLFAWSSVTYMTEVPYVFASSVALYFLVRAEKEERTTFVIIACVAIAVSWFVRQTGVVNAVAALAVVLLLRRWKWAAALAATIAVFGAIALFRLNWLTGAPQELAVHYQMWTESSFRLPQQIEVAYHYLDLNVRNSALFFLPLVVAIVPRKRAAWIVFVVALVLLGARAQSLIRHGLPLPFVVGSAWCCDVFGGQLFTNLGLGPFTVRDGQLLYPVQLAMPARLALTYASVILGALLLAVRPRREAAFPFAFAIAGTLALLASGLYVDRYALDSAWALAVALPLCIEWNSRTKAFAVAALIAIALFDVAAIHDDLAWNRARWAAFRDLRARGVPVEQIDAGGEPWAFYEISKGDRNERRKHQFGLPPRPYTVTFAPLPQGRVVAKYPFRSWMGLGRESSIYVTWRPSPGLRPPSPRERGEGQWKVTGTSG